MDFLPCPRRQKQVLLDKSGEKQTVNKCSELACDHLNELVTPEICNQCPFRFQAIAMQEHESADVPQSRVFREKVDNDSGGYVLCDYRTKQTLVKPCGRVEYVRKCNCPVGPMNQQKVTAAICESCPLRVVGGVQLISDIKVKG